MPWVVGLVVGVLGLLRTRRWIWGFVIVGVVLTPQARNLLPAGPDGIVSELNDRSALVTYGQGTVLIRDADNLMVGDYVGLIEPNPITLNNNPSDFSWNRYVAINRIQSVMTIENIQTHRRNTFLDWCVTQWNHSEGFLVLVKAVLFQSDPEGLFGIILGTGLIFALINRLLMSLFSLFLRERINAILRFELFVGLAIFLGFPLALLRYVISFGCALTIKNRWLRWCVSVGMFWVLNPLYLTSMTILIPLFFQLMGLLNIPSVSRGLSFSVLQGFVWHRTFPLTTLSYGVLRTAFAGLIVSIWIATVVPSLQSSVIMMFNYLEQGIGILNSLWEVHGEGSMLSWIVLSAGLHVARKNAKVLPLSLAVLLLWMPLLSAPWFDTLTVIDVGQGNAVLLSTPFNQSVVLIDTGRASAYASLASVLNRSGVMRMDALILTHEDADHAENADSIKRDYRIRQFITTSQDIKLPSLWLTALDASVSHPTDNQSSLVYGIRWGDHRFLLMGDAEVTNERALLARYPKLKADVVLLGHHGSASSTSDLWLGSLEPQMALISVGRNGYGHPHPSVIKRLSDFHIPTLTTLTEGSLRFIITPWMTILVTDSWKLKILP